MSLSLPQDDHTTLFRTAWTLYDAISEQNYMFHREIYAQVAELLGRRHQRGPYTLLDLGCGNARFLAPCLQTATPERYDGVDLSPTALEEARDYLRGVSNVTLHHNDMLQAVSDATTAYDIIFSGFAMHHLDSEAKQQLFHACAAKLVPGGQFILVDVVREEDQTREQYLENYLHFMRTQWTTVLSDQLDEACSHVATYDFPETLADLTQMARNASFAKAEMIGRHGQHYLLVFGR
ncbi:MAG: class I SAM-dependent methyltransferase [Verrucomicrobiaceae bacterium]